MHRTSFLLALSVALLSAVAPAPAQAQPREGALRLGGDIDLLAFAFFPDRVTTINLGPGANVDRFQPVGQARGLGFSFAYQLSDQLVLGSRARLGFSYADFDGGGDTTLGTVSLLPFVEFLFGRGDVVPFAGVQAGFTILVPEDGDVSGGIVAGGLFGLHIFLAPGFSFSPQLQANFLYDFDLLGVFGTPLRQDGRAGFDLVGLMAFQGWFSP